MSASDRSHVGDLLTRAAPDTVALIDRSRPGHPATTYGQLRSEVAAVAGALRASGIEPGARIGILADNSGDYYRAFFGILEAGGVVVPLNTKLPVDTQRYIVDDAAIGLVISDEANVARVPQGVPLVTFESDEWAAMLASPAATERAATGGDDIALHIYTSGSTGRPKGVLLSHHAVWWTCTQYGVALEGEIMLVSAPLYHKNALMGSKLAFVGGGTVVLLARFDAAQYVDAIAEHGVTMCSGVPTMYALVTAELNRRAGRADLASVKRVMIGSAPITAALEDDVARLFPGAAISNSYGTTEAVLEFAPHPDGRPRPPTSVGVRHPNVEVRLVGEDGADGDHGELWVRSPGVMTGYHNLADVTAERLVDGWYRTGDVMRRDADGWYFFVGRTDDMFVCAGENIYPDAVEQILERHPAVHQAVVVPVPDELKGQLPAAFVRPEPGVDVTVAELKAWTLERGPAYAHPRRVWFVDEIPLASTNKIDRRALVAEAGRRVADDPVSGGRDD